MPDFRSTPPPTAETLPNHYPTCGPPATPALFGRIRDKISAEGPIPFSAYMALVLYHPEYGYYAKDTRQVGKNGDFFTSVSVGPLFGRILARRFLAWWEENHQPPQWRIIETGAHDGTLAADILGELATLSPEAFRTLEYAIPEPLPLLRAAQQEKLAAFPNIRHVLHPGELAAAPLPGIAFGNEVLDALPFEIITHLGGRWHETQVALIDEQLTLQDGPEYPHGPAGEFPEGYRTEIRRNHREFFTPFLSALRNGLHLWFDYGYDAETYYHPSRITGTIRTFARHQAGEDPLIAPGEQDITAHVDFTSAAAAAQELGCTVAPLRAQSSWLTSAARSLLLSMEGAPDPAFLRQFQTLTHPGQLGTRFQVLEFTGPA